MARHLLHSAPLRLPSRRHPPCCTALPVRLVPTTAQRRQATRRRPLRLPSTRPPPRLASSARRRRHPRTHRLVPTTAPRRPTCTRRHRRSTRLRRLPGHPRLRTRIRQPARVTSGRLRITSRLPAQATHPRLRNTRRRPRAATLVVRTSSKINSILCVDVHTILTSVLSSPTSPQN